MRGRVGALLAAAAVAGLMGAMAGTAQGQGMLISSKFYAVVEIRGFDVTSDTFSEWRADAAKKFAEAEARLKDEAGKTQAANAAVQKDLTVLRGKLGGAKLRLNQAKDDAAKEAAKKQVADMEDAIKQKEAEILPVVAWQFGGPFKESEDADAFIKNIEQRVGLAKVAAEAKAKAEEAKRAKTAETAAKAEEAKK